jgi:hypothetical protein
MAADRKGIGADGTQDRQVIDALFTRREIRGKTVRPKPPSPTGWSTKR